MHYDPIYMFFLIPGALIAIWAQIKLSSTYARYSRVGTESGLSGAEAAREILDRAGLHDVPISEVPGHLTDHYDPTKRALFLSSEIFHGRTIAAVGVAAHEAGHALQHQAAYAPLKLRMAIVPVTQFASMASVGILIASAIFHVLPPIFITLGIAVFGAITFFQLVTLPVEYDASRRAKAQLSGLGLVNAREGGAVSQVLSAAALTYVAAMVNALMQLLYFLSLTQRGSRN